MNFDEIINTYNETTSLRKTAKVCGISTGKVRKILVTCEAFDSDLCRMVSDLHASGKNIKEIANTLNRSEQCIISYLPYTRGERTGKSQTKNAINIRKCRARKDQDM